MGVMGLVGWAEARSNSNIVFGETQIKWLLGFAAGTDKSTQLTACKLLARLSYPTEAVAGIREQIASSPALTSILRFARQGILTVHKKLKATDVQIDSIITQGTSRRAIEHGW
jgi:hypothetical protein